MKTLRAIVRDLCVIGGLTLIAAGLWSRFSWEVAAIVTGTILFISGVVAGRRRIAGDAI